MGRTSVKAVNKYIQKAYDRINFVMPKGRKARIQECADKAGISASAWINCAIVEKMQKNPDGVIETERTFAEFVAEVQGLEECALEAGMRIEEYVKMAALEKMEKDVVSSLSIPQQKESFL